MLRNKYKIIEKIGSGAFGSIYKGQNIRTNEYVAIKTEPISSNLKLLIHETKIYQHLNGCAGIPIMKWFGKDDLNYYMVLNLLGTSLQEILKRSGPFSLVLVLQIGIKMILLLKTIHEKGIVHRDIKPDNVIFDREGSNLYVIDFGFCKSYLDTNHFHIKMKQTASMIGSKNYCSLSSHQHMELSRRDDLESLGYMLLYLYSGDLPWSKESVEQNILMLKREIVYRKDKWPPILLEWIDYTRKMEFTEDPNYFYSIELFTKEMEKKSISSV